ncbi:MAG: phosphoglycerate mutase family protein [Methanomassiliicoccales archaeon]
MKILLFRHGKPEDGDDPRLSDEGKRQVMSVAMKAKLKGAEPSLIISSPLRRATETAIIARKVAWRRAEISISQLVGPDASAEDVTTASKQNGKVECVMIVTHLPVMLEVLKANKLRIASKPPYAGMLCTDLREEGNSLLWTLTPD